MSAMLGLLALLASGLLVGKLVRRVTPAAQVLLLGLVTAIVLLEFASWSRGSGSFQEFLQSFLSSFR